jgi:hypothetical protein
MNCPEQKKPNETAELPTVRLPRRKVLRPHPPAAARAGYVTRCVQDLTQVNLRLAALLGRLRQDRRDPIPFLIRQVGRIPLRFLLDIDHSVMVRLGPHPKLESRRIP